MNILKSGGLMMIKNETDESVLLMDEEILKYDMMFQRMNEYLLLMSDKVTTLPLLDLFLFACKKYRIHEKAVIYGSLDKKNVNIRMRSFVDYYLDKIIDFNCSDKQIYRGICKIIEEEIFGIFEEEKNNSFRKKIMLVS